MDHVCRRRRRTRGQRSTGPRQRLAGGGSKQAAERSPGVSRTSGRFCWVPQPKTSRVLGWVLGLLPWCPELYRAQGGLQPSVQTRTETLLLGPIPTGDCPRDGLWKGPLLLEWTFCCLLSAGRSIPIVGNSASAGRGRASGAERMELLLSRSRKRPGERPRPLRSQHGFNRITDGLPGRRGADGLGGLTCSSLLTWLLLPPTKRCS